MYDEKRIGTEYKFKGRIINLRIDEVELPDGQRARREVIEHPGGVAVLPVDKDGTVYLVRQYRTPVGGELLEAPAGKLERGEEHRACGIRELKEETGFDAKEFIYLGYMLPTPGYTDEIIHLYLARGLSAGDASPDDDEFVSVERYSFGEVYAMCADGRINDAKTVVAVMRAKAAME